MSLPSLCVRAAQAAALVALPVSRPFRDPVFFGKQWGGSGCSLELRDLVEAELDRRLALEQGDEHGELAALRLDLADGAREARERALLDGDGLADLEVDLGGDDARGGLLTLRGTLGGGCLDLHEALQHREGLFETQRGRVVAVA